MYRLLNLTRIWNEKAKSLQRQGRLGALPSLKGQEAAGVGIAFAMHKEDWFVPAFREAGALFHLGISLRDHFLFWGGDERGGGICPMPSALPMPINIKMKKAPSSAVLSITRGDAVEELVADKVLVAVGHEPTTADLGLENINIALDDRGFIKVNERLQSSADNVYAIGDVVSGPMPAHRASHMGKVAAEVISGAPSAFDNLAIPGVIFSDPEIAAVGLTDRQAEQRGYAVKVGLFPFKALGRAWTLGETAGMTKIVSDAESGTVLGVHIIGAHASDLIAEEALAVETAAHIEDLMLTIHAHPTLAEGPGEAADAVERKAIHIFHAK